MCIMSDNVYSVYLNQIQETLSYLLEAKPLFPSSYSREVLVLYLERPHEAARDCMLSDGALLIQRLEGSRPHGGLCTLNGSDRVQKVKTFAVMGRICGFDGWMELGSRVLKRQEVAGKAGYRAVLAR